MYFYDNKEKGDVFIIYVHERVVGAPSYTTPAIVTALDYPRQAFINKEQIRDFGNVAIKNNTDMNVMPQLPPFNADCYLDKQPIKTAKDIAWEQRRVNYMTHDEIRRAIREYQLANPWA